MKKHDILFNLERGLVPLAVLDKATLLKVLDTYGYPCGLQHTESLRNAENQQETDILKDVFVADKKYQRLKSIEGKNIEIGQRSLFEALFEKRPLPQSPEDKQCLILADEYWGVINRLRRQKGGRLISRSRAYEAVQRIVANELKYRDMHRE